MMQSLYKYQIVSAIIPGQYHIPAPNAYYLRLFGDPASLYEIT
jgi:hypothetical protein